MSSAFLLVFALLLAYGATSPPSFVAPPRRGVYISPYVDRIGQLIFNLHNATRQFEYILDSQSKENDVLVFLWQNGINAMSLFDLHRIFPYPTRVASMRRFIKRARMLGVSRVEAVGGTATLDYDRIAAYQNDTAIADDEKFDGIVTEVEFWWSSFSKVSLVLSHLQTLRPKPRSDFFSSYFYTSVYIGFPNSTILERLIDDYSVDMFFVSGYTKSPDLAFANSRGRITDLLNTNRSVRLAMLLSAEGQTYSAGIGKFMGDWLLNNSMTIAENAFSSLFQEEFGGHNQRDSLIGAQWYEYAFLRLYNRLNVPPHVADAQELVPLLVGQSNRYTNVTEDFQITWSGEAISAATDSSAFLTLLLRHSYPTVLNESRWQWWMDSDFPTASDYYWQIVTENGFLDVTRDPIFRIAAGDIIAFARSGVVMVAVNATPRFSHYQTSTSGGVANDTEVFSVQVIDSSPAWHGTRQGIGTGKVQLAVDRRNFSIAYYSPSATEGTPLLPNGSHPFVIGRLQSRAMRPWRPNPFTGAPTTASVAPPSSLIVATTPSPSTAQPTTSTAQVVTTALNSAAPIPTGTPFIRGAAGNGADNSQPKLIGLIWWGWLLIATLLLLLLLALGIALGRKLVFNKSPKEKDAYEPSRWGRLFHTKKDDTLTKVKAEADETEAGSARRRKETRTDAISAAPPKCTTLDQPLIDPFSSSQQRPSADSVVEEPLAEEMVTARRSNPFEKASRRSGEERGDPLL